MSWLFHVGYGVFWLVTGTVSVLSGGQEEVMMGCLALGLGIALIEIGRMKRAGE